MIEDSSDDALLCEAEERAVESCMAKRGLGGVESAAALGYGIVEYIEHGGYPDRASMLHGDEIACAEREAEANMRERTHRERRRALLPKCPDP